MILPHIRHKRIQFEKMRLHCEHPNSKSNSFRSQKDEGEIGGLLLSTLHKYIRILFSWLCEFLCIKLDLKKKCQFVRRRHISSWTVIEKFIHLLRHTLHLHSMHIGAQMRCSNETKRKKSSSTPSDHFNFETETHRRANQKKTYFAEYC